MAKTPVQRARSEAMAKTAVAQDQLRKGAKVVARRAMRDVPEGTEGKVSMVTGISWIRYWVRFDNGVSLGTIDRKALATPDEWQRHLAGEDDDDVVDGSEESAGADTGADAGAAAGGGGGVTTPNGTLIPQLLIDRAAAARKRLQG